MTAIDDLLIEFGDEPYTRERYDTDLARVLARLREKHGVVTREEVHAIVAEHRYTHSGDDPEQDYIELVEIERAMGWGS